MDFYANEGKAVTIQANGKTYARHAITTHFVQVGENYIDLLERYVIPVYQPGDILSASEKVIALCQGRVVTEEQVKPGFWAKLLSRFVHQTAAGPGMGLPVKMQFAINFCGLGKVLKAAVCAGLNKLRGIHGTFYDMLDDEVRGLDGFWGRDIPEYAHSQGVVLPRREQGLGGVGLGICVNEQHPLAVLGGQDGGHIDGGDGLPDAALKVHNSDSTHSSISLLRMGAPSHHL